MGVTLQQLEFFRAVVRNLSFSRAARELYTSQPYVSNQIRRLEDHYGVPLFVRSHPRIALTEAGEVLRERIEKILDDLEELEQVAQQFKGLHCGTIQLAATESAGNHVLPELISSFNKHSPEIVVHARVGNTEDVLEWLSLDEVEIGISPRKPDNGNLTAEPFYRERLIVIYPSHLDLPDPLPVETLAKLPKVAREDGSLTLAKMREVLDLVSSGTDFVAQLGGTTAVNEAVAAGLGVSLVPERSARAWLEAGSVRMCNLEGHRLYHSFYLLYSQQRYLTPAARAFIEHLRRSARHQDRD
ncbi:MAG TPA: LysR family transcriptional regulator [Actinopolymorphaceae bacterium]